MRRLQQVIWTKGTLLNPQHLQVQDRFLESNLEFQLDVLSFRPWGFSRLRIDQEALANGVVAIGEAAGIFPDGLLFDVPVSDAGPASRALSDAFGAYVTEGRIHTHDFHATLLHLMGLDHEQLTYRYSGRDYRLTDVEGTVVKEILA